MNIYKYEGYNNCFGRPSKASRASGALRSIYNGPPVIFRLTIFPSRLKPHKNFPLAGFTHHSLTIVPGMCGDGSSEGSSPFQTADLLR